ncbi:MAG: hypothetical protein IJH36_03175 [Clostridia bacterium]|nr:hypothetical protein [Clostridia bacterium]MBQ3462103.1 hypothetical protein [Clostridia bacterium]MBQ3472253.1 hypothetical protein [Clostridia bacterium]MBQ9599778.1 hypothetical protein [Clostridia bacterium]MBR0470982.1 hypothetical protein [Clostridia bacterium]
MTIKQMYEFLERLCDGGFDNAPITAQVDNCECEILSAMFTFDMDGDGYVTIRMTEQLES